MKTAKPLFLLALALLFCALGCSRPDPKAEAETRMKRVLLLLVSTVSDSKELIYPDLSTPDAAKTSLAAALAKEKTSDGREDWDATLFVHPGSNSPFIPNASLSNLPAFKVETPANVVAFYAPQPDGAQRLAGYADGHIEWVDEANWPLKKNAGGVK